MPDLPHRAGRGQQRRHQQPLGDRRPSRHAHPAAISENSYGTLETADVVKQNDAHYNHPGVPIAASAGDGKTVEFPASSQYVIAVTGSTLTRAREPRAAGASRRGRTRAAAAAPSKRRRARQKGRSSCTTRAVGDVAFVADVSAGVAVFKNSRTAAGKSWAAPTPVRRSSPACTRRRPTRTSAGAQLLYANAAKLNPVTPAATGSVSALGQFPNGFAGI